MWYLYFHIKAWHLSWLKLKTKMAESQPGSFISLLKSCLIPVTHGESISVGPTIPDFSFCPEEWDRQFWRELKRLYRSRERYDSGTESERLWASERTRERETERQRDRETERQTERERERERERAADNDCHLFAIMKTKILKSHSLLQLTPLNCHIQEMLILWKTIQLSYTRNAHFMEDHTTVIYKKCSFYWRPYKT